MSTKILPLGKNVLIQQDKPETKTAAGIYVPESASQEKSQQGKVVAVGDSEEIMVKKGQVVVFDEYSGKKITVEGEDYVIVKADELIAVIE